MSWDEKAGERVRGMPFFDAHNHLHDERFEGRQEELIAACRAVGVEAMVVNGSCEEDWPAVGELARRHPGFVIPAFGLHPWYLPGRTPAWLDRLNRWLDEVPGAVIGEIGMDRWILDRPLQAASALPAELADRPPAPLEEQEDVFRVQLGIAAERNVAASIHCLQAWGRLHDVLREGPLPGRGFLLHSYGGPAEMVGPLARLGARFGFPGYFLHARKARQREVFRVVPRDRLLVETDAPDQRLPEATDAVGGGAGFAAVLRLTGADGRPLNHPANLPVIQGALAGWLGEDTGTLAVRLGRNFRWLFAAGR